jgi:hypothetical protein
MTLMSDQTHPHEILETHNWFDYANFYDRMAARSDFHVYVELGCWKGHSLRHLARRLQARSEPVSIYGVDLWDTSYLKENAPEVDGEADDFLFKMYDKNLVEAGVRAFVRDIRECSWEAASRFDDGAVDFVFVDADHAYESVIRDIRAWLPKLRPGGIIAGHDYFNYASVRRAVEEIFQDRFEVEGSVWIVGDRVESKGIDEARRRLQWLERQREAWIHAADQRQATIQQQENSLKWAEDQRSAWQATAQKSEERLYSWRLVAEQREQTLIELERVTGLLESAKQRLTDECDRLEALERKASTALAEAREELAHPFVFRLKKGIKAMFPRETVRGRFARRLARIAK